MIDDFSKFPPYQTQDTELSVLWTFVSSSVMCQRMIANLRDQNAVLNSESYYLHAAPSLFLAENPAVEEETMESNT